MVKRTLRLLAVIIVVFTAGVLVVHNSSSGSPPSDQTSSLGKSIYDSKCVECHGMDGKGAGPAASYLTPRPRNFTDGIYKFRSTESGSIPSDEDLMSSIQNGLHGTAMPDWKPFLKNDSLKAVIDYIKSFSPRFANEQPKPVNIGATVAFSPSAVAEGKKLYENLECGSCHGTDGKGTDAVAVGLVDDWGHDIKATNLTEPWTFRGGPDVRSIYLRIRTGIDGTPMPSYLGSATEKEMWNLAHYVVSLARNPVWSMNEQEIKNFYAQLDDNAKKNPVERGKYIVNSIGCGFCHTPFRDDGSIIEELRFAGGQRWNLYPFGDFVSYNLTSDKETGLGEWTDDEIKTFVTKGIRRDGSRMLPYPMPWPSYAGLKEDDLNAMVAYLRTIPPIKNEIPKPEQPNIFSYLWGKFEVLILGKIVPGYVYPGNAGIVKEKTMSENISPSNQTSKEKQQ